MNEDDREHTPGIAALPPKVDRAALAGLAGSARKALDDLRPGGKAPPRRTLAGEAMWEISVRLKVVTPILGGGPKLRDVDRVDIIRAPAVRGHLRFWWRALYGHLYGGAAALYKDESALWGRPADDQGGGRSAVEIRLRDVKSGGVDPSDIIITSSKKKGTATQGAYALWPAQSQEGNEAKNKPKVEQAPRCKPGLTFTLALIGPANCSIAGVERNSKAVLQNVIRAWILFGGYGSRTRRGFGSLTVTGTDPKNEKKDEAQQRAKWLPAAEVEDDSEALRRAITTYFGWDLFQQSEKPTTAPGTSPRFAKAAMLLPLPDPDDLNIDYIGVSATDAWLESLGWLRSFRQGTDTEGARQGTFTNPGVSNWPEADKIRRLADKSTAHEPRHNEETAFPRAGFGLPIGMKFKRGDGDPDGQFDILWRSSQGNHERLASPLILKPLPLANGRFLPMALWLNRNDPTGSKVYVDGYEKAAVDFNVLVAAGDKPQYSGAVAEALKSKSTLRDAFVAYLEKRGLQRIAP